MAVTYGFYNSIDGDRKYNAEQMAMIFDGIIGDGVFSAVGNAFSVSPSGGMVISVASGRAWFNHTWTYNDAPITLTVSDAPVGSLKRIDAVVIEVDSENRTNAIKMVDGTESVTPEIPELTSTDTVRQYALAYITLDSSVQAITSTMIRSAVGTDTPFVTGPLETVGVTGLYNFWREEFEDWFDHLQDELDENQAAHLQHQIDTLTAIKANVTDLEDAISRVNRVGDIKYSMQDPGENWMLCDGSYVSLEQEHAEYSVIARQKKGYDKREWNTYLADTNIFTQCVSPDCEYVYEATRTDGVISVYKFDIESKVSSKLPALPSQETYSYISLYFICDRLVATYRQGTVGNNYGACVYNSSQNRWDDWATVFGSITFPFNNSVIRTWVMNNGIIITVGVRSNNSDRYLEAIVYDNGAYTRITSSSIINNYDIFLNRNSVMLYFDESHNCYTAVFMGYNSSTDSIVLTKFYISSSSSFSSNIEHWNYSSRNSGLYANTYSSCSLDIDSSSTHGTVLLIFYEGEHDSSGYHPSVIIINEASANQTYWSTAPTNSVLDSSYKYTNKASLVCLMSSVLSDNRALIYNQDTSSNVTFVLATATITNINASNASFTVSLDNSEQISMGIYYRTLSSFYSNMYMLKETDDEILYGVSDDYIFIPVTPKYNSASDPSLDYIPTFDMYVKVIGGIEGEGDIQRLKEEIIAEVLASIEHLPEVSTSDNGKFLRVVLGEWDADSVPEARGDSY